MAVSARVADATERRVSTPTTDDILEAIQAAMAAPPNGGPAAATVEEIRTVTGRSAMYVRNYIRRMLREGRMERVSVMRVSEMDDRRYKTHAFRLLG